MSVFSQLWLGGFTMTMCAIAMFICIALSFNVWQDSASEWDLKWILRIISFFFALTGFFLLGLEFIMWETMISPVL